MAKNRREHFRKTRKSRMRDLKQSPTGVLSMVCALAAAGLVLAAVIVSYMADGSGQYLVGGLAGTGLVLAAGAFALGIFCKRTQEGIRPLPPNTGIRLGAVLSVFLIVVFIMGCV